MVVLQFWSLIRSLSIACFTVRCESPVKQFVSCIVHSHSVR